MNFLSDALIVTPNNVEFIIFREYLGHLVWIINTVTGSQFNILNKYIISTFKMPTKSQTNGDEFKKVNWNTDYLIWTMVDILVDIE
jgi:hypothetical protein